MPYGLSRVSMKMHFPPHSKCDLTGFENKPISFNLINLFRCIVATTEWYFCLKSSIRWHTVEFIMTTFLNTLYPDCYLVHPVLLINSSWTSLIYYHYRVQIDCTSYSTDCRHFLYLVAVSLICTIALETAQHQIYCSQILLRHDTVQAIQCTSCFLHCVYSKQ